MSTASNLKLKFHHPDSDALGIAQTDALGRLTVELVEAPDEKAEKKFEAWTKRFYGRGKSYRPVMNRNEARALLQSKGVVVKGEES